MGQESPRLDVVRPTGQFDIALRGYDRQQVDHHLAEIRARFDDVLATSATNEAAREHHRQESQRLSAEAVRLGSRLADAERGLLEAGRRVMEAESAQDLPGMSGAQRLIRLAELTADSMRAEAGAEAEAIMAAAVEQRAALLHEARECAAALSAAESAATQSAAREVLAAARQEAEAIMAAAAEEGIEIVLEVRASAGSFAARDRAPCMPGDQAHTDEACAGGGQVVAVKRSVDRGGAPDVHLRVQARTCPSAQEAAIAEAATRAAALDALEEELASCRTDIRQARNERDAIRTERESIDQHLANLRAGLELFSGLTAPIGEIDQTGKIEGTERIDQAGSGLGHPVG